MYTDVNDPDEFLHYFEMKAKLPSGGGVWPAFWLMPTNSVYGIWPNSGEIDIMEMVGNNASTVLGTTHTAVSGSAGTGGRKYCGTTTTDYNIYALRWTDEKIEFILNGETYYTYSHLSSYTSRQWPFDQEFFLILNVAMGGNLGGSIDSNFNESSMVIDYVRVYQQKDTSDNEKPDKVEITQASSSSSSISLAWGKPNDNQGIKHYEIVVDGMTVGSTIKTKYTIKNLNSNTSYKIQVIAVDLNDNWSISDILQKKTTGTSSIPGTVEAVDFYSSYGEVSHISDNDSNRTSMIALRNGSTVEYSINCSASGTYSMMMRLATRVNCTLTIEVLNTSGLIYEGSVSLSRTYGEYQSTELVNSIILPSGTLTIKIGCTSSASTDSVILNYFDIK